MLRRMWWLIGAWLLPAVAMSAPAARLQIRGLPKSSVETSRPVLEAIEVVNTGTVPLIPLSLDNSREWSGSFPLIFPGKTTQLEPIRIASRWEGHIDPPGHHVVRHSLVLVAPPEEFIRTHWGEGETFRGEVYFCSHKPLPKDAPVPQKEPPSRSMATPPFCLSVRDADREPPGERVNVSAEFAYDVQPDPDIEKFRSKVEVVAFRKNLPQVGTAIETPDMTFVVKKGQLQPIGRVSVDGLEELLLPFGERRAEVDLYVRADAHGRGTALRDRFGKRFTMGTPFRMRGIGTPLGGLVYDDEYLPSELLQKRWKGAPSNLPGEIKLTLELTELPNLWKVLQEDGSRLCPPVAMWQPVYVTKGKCGWSDEQEAWFHRDLTAHSIHIK